MAAAGRHPLVRAAVAEYGASRLRAAPKYTIRATGTTTTGSSVEFTTLPFLSDGDPTHGVFVTVRHTFRQRQVGVGQTTYQHFS